MRRIFLDTETTGLNTAQGHRIIEIAAVEMVDRRLTQRRFHTYLNPDREIDPGAQQVHGITLEFLQDKPRFTDRANDFLEFVAGGELVIHNAPFDVGFINYELGLAGYPDLQQVCGSIVDTLRMAKEMRPGQRNSLDALCRHYGVDNAARTLHGAMLDAELLAEVYLAMTRGQESLMMEMEPSPVNSASLTETPRPAALKVLLAQERELEAHGRYLAALDKELQESSVWGRL